MKTLIAFLCLLVAFPGLAQSQTDTLKKEIIIYDLWQKGNNKKGDTLKDSLKKSNEEMIIIDKKFQKEGQDQRNKTVTIYPDEIEKGVSKVKVSLDGVKEIRLYNNNKYKADKASKRNNYGRFSGNWQGFNFGFVNFTETDFSMYPGSQNFMELDWANSFVMQFNLLQQSINLVPRNNFGFVVGLGLEYQNFRFENRHSSIDLDEHGIIQPVTLDPSWDIKRSTFKTLYLTVPLLMELQLPAKSYKRLYVSGGVMGGLRLHSKTKVVYNQNGKHKKKNTDNFNMIPFKADLIAKIGYRGRSCSYSVWGSYTMTDMFKADKGPKLHPYSIGLGIGF